MKTVKKNKELKDFGFKEDGKYYWWASWYAEVLGYSSLNSLRPSIRKAQNICLQIGLPHEENFIASQNDKRKDIKLTKFACFLIALQADDKKPVVKRARAYFLNQLEEVNILLKDEEYVSRLNAREDIKNLNIDLAKSARRAQVKDFRFFANEGYVGLYNMTMAELRSYRGVDEQANLSDFMSLTELSANIFRITMTKERLKHLRSSDEEKAAREHWKIASQIRSMVKENTGVYPEDLKLRKNINLLQKRLKLAQVELNKVVKHIE